jgi:hypothetical protein
MELKADGIFRFIVKFSAFNKNTYELKFLICTGSFIFSIRLSGGIISSLHEMQKSRIGINRKYLLKKILIKEYAKWK